MEILKSNIVAINRLCVEAKAIMLCMPPALTVGAPGVRIVDLYVGDRIDYR